MFKKKCMFNIFIVSYKTPNRLQSGSKFSYVFCLLFVQCCVNSIIGLFARSVYEKEKKKNYPIHQMALLGFSYIGAMVASNSSLKFINYPTQVIGKSIKPIPVMLFSVIWAKKRYPIKKYFFVSLITLGVMLFMYKDQQKSTQWNLGYGELLLLVSLFLDGLTGGVQQDLVNRFKIGSYNLMFCMNFWSLIYLSIAIYVTNEFKPFLEFIKGNPEVLQTICVFGLTSAIGQVFLFNTITRFSPLLCSIVTTTRKFFTVLGSIILFNHDISTRQWIGTCLVFLGLFLDQIFGKNHSKKGVTAEAKRDVKKKQKIT